MHQLLRRAWYFARHRQAEADLSEEIAFHREMKQRDLETAGLSRRDAAFATSRALGSIALAQDRSRDVWVPSWIQGVGQDVRLALRGMAGSRIVSAAAILSLALGIGASTAIFSVVSSLLLRVLPVVEPQQLAMISSSTDLNDGRQAAWSYPIWHEIQQQARAFDGAIAWSMPQFNLAHGGEPTWVRGLVTNGDFFQGLGVRALVGRTFTSADDVPGGGPEGPVALISYGYWQRRFGGVRTVIGAPIVVEDVSLTIIGVTPPEFSGVEVGKTFDIALPIGTQALIEGGKNLLTEPAYRWLTIMLRLKSGQSLDEATATLRTMQPQIGDAAIPPDGPPGFRERFLNDPLVLVPAATGTSTLRQQYQRPLFAMFVVVALVLGIACVNLANLLLARGSARRQEFSLRLALGASRWRLVRQLLLESLLLASIGAIVGLIVAEWSSRALVVQLSNRTDEVFLDLSLNWHILTFAATVTLTTAALFGTAPAFRATRVAAIDSLKTHGSAERSRPGLWPGLLVAQMTFALILVSGAGLFLRTYARLANVPLGFDRERILAVNVDASHVPAADRVRYYDQLLDEVRSVPGVASAAVSFVTPITGDGMGDTVDVRGSELMSQEERRVLLQYVSPQWLATYGTAIRTGRDFDERDTRSGPRVVLVNESFVHKFFSDRDPIGDTVVSGLGRSRGPKVVVGVASDAVFRSIRNGVEPTLYAPLAQLNLTIANVTISVRSSRGAPRELVRSLASKLSSVDRDLTFSFMPLANQVARSLAQERVLAMLSGVFATLALLLAGLGLYGVTSYAVTQRRSEIGIRMALGASAPGVIRLVMVRASLLLGAGIFAGTVASLWLSQFVATLLYGVEPRGFAILMGAGAVLASVGVLAALVPAWRASRIHPGEVLRCE